jgi:hypothetical protein
LDAESRGPVRVATEFAEALNTVDYRRLGPWASSVESRVTPGFDKQFVTSLPRARSAFLDAKVVSTGSARASAISDISSGTATVLVTVDLSSSSSAHGPVRSVQRYVVHLIGDGGTWLVGGADQAQ